ncbi:MULTISPECIES: hypothetical protein [unclassified Legionella]|uniref:hypothetical protein n=1 Tax=unclassified Legionella TaxID=2622702 RepID=UPI001055A8B9|nr:MULTISPECIES: hypothetical protein [unclassified Legionella]MDI9818953.1 hypothetical protein [Legionella sp. PL877]
MSNITLSGKSKDLISRLIEKDPTLIEDLQDSNQPRETLTYLQLHQWLTRQRPLDKENTFLLEALEVALLKDLNRTLAARQQSSPQSKPAKPSRWGSKANFILLAIAGTVYFGCEGFDGITAMLGTIPSVPSIAVFVVGTVFALLSIIVFYSFDLVEISKNLGVKLSSTSQLLDVYLNKVKQIQEIRKQLSNPTGKSKDVLEEEFLIASMLLAKHEALKEVREKLKSALDNKLLKAGKVLTAAIAGIIFFSGGFFAGETVALYVASCFFASVSATFWPVVVASVLVGIAAFSVYWFVERPRLQNLIGRWVNLDADKIDTLCNEELVIQEEKELRNTHDNLNELVKTKKTNSELTETNQQLSEEVARLKGLLQLKDQIRSEPAVNDVAGFNPNRVNTELNHPFNPSASLRRSWSTGSLRDTFFPSGPPVSGNGDTKPGYSASTIV